MVREGASRSTLSTLPLGLRRSKLEQRVAGMLAPWAPAYYCRWLERGQLMIGVSNDESITNALVASEAFDTWLKIQDRG